MTMLQELDPASLPANRSPSAAGLCQTLHLINGEHFSGAERVQDLLATRLPDFGYTADFACLKLDRFASARNSETRLFNLPMKSSFDFSVIGRAVELVGQHNYQIIHAHTPRTVMIGSFVARRLGLPLVYHVHSPVGRDSTRKFRNRINALIEGRCLRSADALICVSGSLAEYMTQLGHDERKLHVVRNGVPVCEELPDRNPPRDQWTIGTMALFRPRKGIETLLEGLGVLKQRGLNVRLRAVGGFESEDYRDKILKLTRQHGVEESITWTGFQTDINGQLQQMDLFVLPSLFGEGLPMVVLEAMAAGVPVIASDVEGIPEAIRHEVDGLIFEAGSADGLADRVAQVCDQPQLWSQFRSISLNRHEESLSDISMARGVAEVYASLLK